MRADRPVSRIVCLHAPKFGLQLVLDFEPSRNDLCAIPFQTAAIIFKPPRSFSNRRDAVHCEDSAMDKAHVGTIQERNESFPLCQGVSPGR